MLDPRRLLTFREVAHQRSFSRAAAALALSQPAVSQQVGALERELGTALLVRGRAGTVPTPAGDLLLAHADALAARIDLADEQMVALLPADHRLADEEQIALRELADEPWMAPSRDGIIVDACRAAGFEPRLEVLTRDPLAARALAAAGLAVSLTPRLLERIQLPGIALPALRDPAPHRALYAVLPAEGAHPLADALTRELAVAAES